MSTRGLADPILIRNSGEQSLAMYLYWRTSAFSMFWRTYSSAVSLKKLPVIKSTTLPSGTAPIAIGLGEANLPAGGDGRDFALAGRLFFLFMGLRQRPKFLHAQPFGNHFRRDAELWHSARHSREGLSRRPTSRSSRLLARIGLRLERPRATHRAGRAGAQRIPSLG